MTSRALAWRLRAEGREAATLQAARDAGSKWHREHGRNVANRRRLRTAAAIFVAAAVFFSLLLFLYLVFR